MTTVRRAAASRTDPQVLPGLASLSVEQQRFLLAVADGMRGAAEATGLTETKVRNLIDRLVQAALVQERRAPEARTELARTFGPSIVDLDPVPRATVAQAQRLAALRARLLAEGAFSTAAIAEARGMTPGNARQWISRHRTGKRIFTVTQDGETLVPAFLLDANLDPRPDIQPAIRVLRDAGEDGWALWAWFATPSAWFGGRVPVDVLATDPELVAATARERAAAFA